MNSKTEEVLTDDQLQDLKFQYRRNKLWERATTRLSNQSKGILCSFVDGQSEKEVRAKASSMFELIRKDLSSAPLDAVSLTEPLIDAYEVILVKRKELTKILKKVGKELPYASEALKVKGLGEATYAAIIAEAGPLTDYECPAKLWKRFGLAVMNGERQGKVSKKLSREERNAVYIEHGYVPQRRALMFLAAVHVHMAKDPYYKVLYDRWKADELEKVARLHPDGQGVNGHAHNRALRKCGKRLLLNLWKLWHGQDIDVDYYEKNNPKPTGAASMKKSITKLKLPADYC